MFALLAGILRECCICSLESRDANSPNRSSNWIIWGLGEQKQATIACPRVHARHGVGIRSASAHEVSPRQIISVSKSIFSTAAAMLFAPSEYMGNHWSEFMDNHQTVLPSNEDCVVTLFQFASNAGISLVTLRRSIARGEGPTVTKLSTRRGVKVSHARAWLDSRTSSGRKAVALDPADLKSCIGSLA